MSANNEIKASIVEIETEEKENDEPVMAAEEEFGIEWAELELLGKVLVRKNIS